MPRRRNGIDRESLREKLVAVAEALVSQQGAEALTARALAEYIGYSVGHIYNLFPDIDALVLVVRERTLDKLHDHIKQAIKGRKGASRLFALADGYLGFCAENPRLWRLVSSGDSREESPPSEEYATYLAALPALIAGEILSLLPDQAEEQTRKDAALLWASLHGMAQLDVGHHLDAVGAPPSRELGKYLVEAYLAHKRQEKK